MTDYGSLISDLEIAISSGDAERRTETLWRVTDLFITGAEQYSEEHVTLFDDVISRLAAEIEVKARAKLASRLAAIANAPPKVVRALASDENADVAVPLLAHFERLADEDLIDAAKTRSQRHLMAIARRSQLTEPVTDALVVHGNQQVVHSVTKNSGARFSDAGFGVLVKRSEGDDLLAEHVGTRRDIPRHHFLRLIANASLTVKTKLAAAHPDAVRDIQQALAEVVGKIRAESVSASAQFDSAKRSVAARIRAGTLGEADLYECAKARKFEETAVAFSLTCGVPIEVVETAMLDARPDMVLILARAADLSWSTVKAILLLRKSDRGISAADLERALKSFERLQSDTARNVVDFYRARRQASTA